MDYPMMEPPFEIDEFHMMNRKKATEFFDWYISQIPYRLSLLTQAFESTREGTSKDLDFSPESLKTLWIWLREQINYVYKPKKQIWAELSRMPEWLRYTVGTDEMEPSKTTLVLAVDVAIYFGEVFVRNHKEISWGFVTKPKSLIYVNKPVLVGFHKTELEPIRVVSNILKRQNPDALYDLYLVWIKNL